MQVIMFNPESSFLPELRTEGVRDIPLLEIDVTEDRARSFDEQEVKALSIILAASGLQHPIRVRSVGNRFQLIAGRKRLEAFRLMGRETIPSTISSASSDDEAKLEEVMENLGRVDLDALDRCHHLYDLKLVHERMYPHTKNGGDRGNQHTGGRTKNLRSASGSDAPQEILAFAEDTANRIGLSRRAIELAVKIWTDLSPESRARVTGTRIAKKQSALKELSEQSPADQVLILDMVFAEPPKVSTISEAVEILKTGVAKTPVEKKTEVARNALKALPQPVASSIASGQSDAARLAELQKGIATLSKFFGKLQDDELDAVVSDHEERIIASLKRRGRI